MNGSSINIQDIFNKDDLTAGSRQAISSQIQIAKAGGGFNQYWLIDEVDNPDFDDDEPISDENPEVYENVWVLFKSEDDGPANVTLNPGQGFWFKNPDDTSITASGAVVTPVTYKKDLPANEWTLIANPYPKSFGLNDGSVDWAEYCTSGSRQAISAQIQIAKASGGFNQYWLIDEVENPDFDGDEPISAENPEVYENVWVLFKSEDDGPVNVTVPECTGFWMKNPTATSVFFNR